MSNKTIKEKYLPPLVEVIEVENEGVMANSPSAQLPGIGSGSWGSGTVRRSTGSTHQSAGVLQDLEDLINEILTVEK